jgi:hypothetical protein
MTKGKKNHILGGISVLKWYKSTMAKNVLRQTSFAAYKNRRALFTVMLRKT